MCGEREKIEFCIEWLNAVSITIKRTNEEHLDMGSAKTTETFGQNVAE